LAIIHPLASDEKLSSIKPSAADVEWPMIHIKTELPFVGWIEKSRTSLGE
jgi:hypothetical protein